MKVHDYNGDGRWSSDEIIQRYCQYSHELQVLNPVDLSPVEHVEGETKWVYPVMDKVIAGIEQGDAACRRIGIEFIEEDRKFAFGRILKSNTARALRRSELTAEEQDRIRRRVVHMLLAGNVPREYKQYAKLIKNIGVGEYWDEIESRIDRSNQYAMRYYKYLKLPSGRLAAEAPRRLPFMNNAGIYIHIPFCRSRCSYCDFATGMYNSALAERYVRAIAGEINGWQEVNEPQRVDTVYFGGGTPSLLSFIQLEHILHAVRARFNVTEQAEVTLEMNPGTVTPEILGEFRQLGVNRASFGAQTFDDLELRRLGRTHTAAETRQTFNSLRAAGFENVSFDLIAGLPGQTVEGWRRNLEEALELRPEHLSFYLLEVHEGTPLADQIKRGTQPQPDDDLAAEMYRLMLEMGCAAGYEHYEISNLCLPGFESRHNTKYWTGAPYYGFGCSAHSYDGEFKRWSNERDAASYTQLIEQGRSPIVETVQLSPDEVRAEAVFLGLRMMRGISAGRYQTLFGVDLREKYAHDLLRFSNAGLIEVDGDLIKLTRDGALLSNEVFSAFV